MSKKLVASALDGADCTFVLLKRFELLTKNIHGQLASRPFYFFAVRFAKFDEFVDRITTVIKKTSLVLGAYLVPGICKGRIKVAQFSIDFHAVDQIAYGCHHKVSVSKVG